MAATWRRAAWSSKGSARRFLCALCAARNQSSSEYLHTGILGASDTIRPEVSKALATVRTFVQLAPQYSSSATKTAKDAPTIRPMMPMDMPSCSKVSSSVCSHFISSTWVTNVNGYRHGSKTCRQPFKTEIEQLRLAWGVSRCHHHLLRYRHRQAVWEERAYW